MHLRPIWWPAVVVLLAVAGKPFISSRHHSFDQSHATSTVYRSSSHAPFSDAQTPVIGGLCKLGSSDVQIGGKQTQFFLKCEERQG